MSTVPPADGGDRVTDELDDGLDDDLDLGEPITATLEKLQAVHPVSPEFHGRLERRIERVQVTADFSRMWWEVPGAAVKELLLGLFSPGARPARRRPAPAEAPPTRPTLQDTEGGDDG